jgi:hypothetical protein
MMDRDFLAANLLSPALKVPLDAKLGICGARKMQLFYLCYWPKRSGVDDCALVMVMT